MPMKRYISERAIKSLVNSYTHCVHELRLASNSFTKEYWKGKRAGIIESLCLLCELQWSTAEWMLEGHRKAMLQENSR